MADDSNNNNFNDRCQEESAAAPHSRATEDVDREDFEVDVASTTTLPSSLSQPQPPQPVPADLPADIAGWYARTEPYTHVYHGPAPLPSAPSSSPPVHGHSTSGPESDTRSVLIPHSGPLLNNTPLSQSTTASQGEDANGAPPQYRVDAPPRYAQEHPPSQVAPSTDSTSQSAAPVSTQDQALLQETTTASSEQINMARSALGYSRDRTIEATLAAFAWWRNNTSATYLQVYRFAVDRFFELAERHTIPDRFIIRQDFDVTFVDTIIQETRSPHLHTREELDRLQVLGVSLMDLDPRVNRDPWTDNAHTYGRRIGLVLSLHELRRLTGVRDWRRQWVRGTLVECPPQADTSNNLPRPRGSSVARGDSTVTRRNAQLSGLEMLAERAQQNDESGARAAATPSTTAPFPFFAGKPSSSNPPASAVAPTTGRITIHLRVGSPPPANATLRLRPTSTANATNNPFRVTVDAAGTTTWARNIGGRWVPFAQHRRQQRQWRCLLCRRWPGSDERGQLTTHLQRADHGLTAADLHRHMNAPFCYWGEDAEWDDNEGCYIWGMHVKGDAKPDKCMLCEGREFKAGTSSLKRHIALSHGLDCGVVPPVTDGAVRRHQEKKEMARAKAEAEKAADAAALDDEDSDVEMQDAEEGDEAEMEVEDDDVLEDFFERATGARNQDDEEAEE